eukprot:1433222-Pleurochrysis_carterae.AAC.1
MQWQGRTWWLATASMAGAYEHVGTDVCACLGTHVELLQRPVPERAPNWLASRGALFAFRQSLNGRC